MDNFRTIFVIIRSMYWRARDAMLYTQRHDPRNPQIGTHPENLGDIKIIPGTYKCHAETSRDDDPIHGGDPIHKGDVIQFEFITQGASGAVRAVMDEAKYDRDFDLEGMKEPRRRPIYMEHSGWMWECEIDACHSAHEDPDDGLEKTFMTLKVIEAHQYFERRDQSLKDALFLVAMIVGIPSLLGACVFWFTPLSVPASIACSVLVLIGLAKLFEFVANHLLLWDNDDIYRRAMPQPMNVPGLAQVFGGETRMSIGPYRRQALLTIAGIIRGIWWGVLVGLSVHLYGGRFQAMLERLLG